MLVNWIKDADAALEQAKSENRPLLIDFSAAPARGACARLEAESYSDQEIADFINQNFVPLEAHIKEHPAYFKRFEAVWTPTILVGFRGGRALPHRRLPAKGLVSRAFADGPGARALYAQEVCRCPADLCRCRQSLRDVGRRCRSHLFPRCVQVQSDERSHFVRYCGD